MLNIGVGREIQWHGRHRGLIIDTNVFEMDVVYLQDVVTGADDYPR